MAHDTNLSQAGGQPGSQLGRLSDLDDFQVAEGYPDIRGWTVKSADGTDVGKVDDLVVDTAAMRVRYLDVDLDRSVRDRAAGVGGDDDGHVLLPVGAARLDDARDDVLVDGYTAAQIGALPRYSGRNITSEYETSLRGEGLAAAGLTGAGVASDRDDDEDQRLFAARRRPNVRDNAPDDTARLTLAEEQLTVGKRAVEAGRVDVRKEVDVEHVQEQVSLTHEEVTVERRPLSAGASANPTITEDEIRIPVMEEEITVQKRLVPREEIIVRKRAVTEQQTVEADVRRERVEIDDRSARGTPSAGTGARSLADRAADAVDDTKDRVDGNPASRPGRDATDRGGRLS